jgi:ribosome biogenesis GTPase / thiamine phosphate phosphatase
VDAIGWPRDLAIPEGMRGARVVSVYAARVDLLTASGPLRASLRSRTLREVEGGVAVGDWVLLHGRDDVVETVLPRRTVFLRQAAGDRPTPQAIAANVDRVFIVTSADADFNVRRLERYLVAIAAGGAEGQIVLTKADVAEDLDAMIERARTLGEAFATSAKSGRGIDTLRERMAGKTTALVGSSGVGKSALVNALIGHEAQLEGEVRAWDGKGRHTTTRRALFVLPNDGFLIDTPGMRELEPWLPGSTPRQAEHLAKRQKRKRFKD